MLELNVQVLTNKNKQIIIARQDPSQLKREHRLRLSQKITKKQYDLIKRFVTVKSIEQQE